MNEHTVKSFDDEISQLRGLIAQMGGLAEVAIQGAMAALVKHDSATAQKVVEDDRKIDAIEVEVEKLAVRIKPIPSACSRNREKGVTAGDGQHRNWSLAKNFLREAS